MCFRQYVITLVLFVLNVSYGFRLHNVMRFKWPMLHVVTEHFSEEEQVHKTEVSASRSSMDSGKQKPKRKWGLLGGGGRTKSSSNAKGSKSNTLTKETTSDEDVAGNLLNRWSTGLPRLPLPATISKETMVSSSRVLL
jgi:hypothetical protein